MDSQYNGLCTDDIIISKGMLMWKFDLLDDLNQAPECTSICRGIMK